jgi:adenylate kinase
LSNPENEPFNQRQAIILLGEPTSGKSSQATLLGETFAAPVIRGRSLVPGLAQAYESDRNLIPDDIFISRLEDELRARDEPCLIFDNIPRTKAQAEAMVNWAASEGVSLHVLRLRLTLDQVQERARKRLVCPTCSTTYHPDLKPPARLDRCDRDGSELVARTGDNPEVVKKGYWDHQRQDAEVIGVLSKEGTVHELFVEGSIESAHRRICDLLHEVFETEYLAPRGESFTGLFFQIR